MTITIDRVNSQAVRRAFYKFAWQVYGNDPQWVPPLWSERRAYLTKEASFFIHGKGEFWLARQGRDIVGTIGTAVDIKRNEDTGTKTAIFGFFEVLPDHYDAASAMWDWACQWGRDQGMNVMEGPLSFTTSADAGLLIEGHKTSPAILMTHTPPYYAIFAERYGFQKELDSLAYRIKLPPQGGIPPLLKRIAQRTYSRHGSDVIRKPALNCWEQEIRRLHTVYNKSLSTLPEFSPISLEEFQAQAQALRSIIDPDLVFIAEMEGEVAGFALGLPDINQALIRANGLQHPWDYLRFAAARRHITNASFKILAIAPEWWGYGLEGAMFYELARAVIGKGYSWLDLSLTSETNPQTNKIVQRFGAQVYRRYRRYRLRL